MPALNPCIKCGSECVELQKGRWVYTICTNCKAYRTRRDQAECINAWNEMNPLQDPNQTSTKPEVDNVNHPAHYTQGGIECIDALKAATCNLVGVEAFCTANAIKYLWRWKLKGGVESLKKAIFYIEHLIKELETQQS